MSIVERSQEFVEVVQIRQERWAICDVRPCASESLRYTGPNTLVDSRPPGWSRIEVWPPDGPSTVLHYCPACSEIMLPTLGSPGWRK